MYVLSVLLNDCIPIGTNVGGTKWYQYQWYTGTVDSSVSIRGDICLYVNPAHGQGLASSL